MGEAEAASVGDILVVEDDLWIVDLIRTMLTDAGYTVQVAAIALARPALLLIDLHQQQERGAIVEQVRGGR
jgi:DNA-binding response OmpR family regulator